MKKLLGLLSIPIMLLGCIPEDILEQPMVAFYPSVTLTVNEGDTQANTITLESSQKVNGEGTVVIEVSNSEHLETVPAITDGKLILTFKDTNKASFTVVAKDENLKGNYKAIFKLGAVSGGIKSVDTKKFVLQVNDNDNAISQPFTEDFSSYEDKKDFAKAGWQNIAQEGGRKWQTRHFRDTKYVQFSAFRASDNANIGWLVLPRVNVSALENKTISFKNAISFGDKAKLELLYSTDYKGTGDIEKATWNTLNFKVGTANNKWVESGVIDLSAIAKVGFIAFRYTGAGKDKNNDGTFRLDDIKVGVEKGGGGGGGDTTPAVNEVVEDFNSFQDKKDFDKKGWQNIAQAGKRKWQTRHFKTTKYTQFSAFRSKDASNIGWLILPKLDFDAMVKKQMTFKNAIYNYDDTKVELMYSTDFDGTNYKGATWKPLKYAISTKNNTWVESGVIDLSAISGKGYIAFRYTGAGTDTKKDGTFRIDDIKVGVEKGGGGGGGDPSLINISEARKKNGQQVKIKGIVTTPDFGFKNDQYYVQDKTGGISVFYGTDQGVKVGDEVELTGKIGKFSDNVQINITAVKNLSSGNPLPTAKKITATDLTTDNALQGSRVVLDGVTITDAATWPTTKIKKGSGANVKAKVGSKNFTIRIDRGESYFDGTPVPAGTFTLTGILARFKNTVQIMPFVKEDIK